MEWIASDSIAELPVTVAATIFVRAIAMLVRIAAVIAALDSDAPSCGIGKRFYCVLNLIAFRLVMKMEEVEVDHLAK
jgi:hypothetical protein